MADFSEKNPEKLENLNQNNSEQIEKLTISAVGKAESSQEDADLIAKVVAVASDKLVNKVVEEVSKNSIDENEALSAKVLKSIVSTNPDKIEKLSDENKDTIIQQSIDAAKNQNENKDDESDDLPDAIADIIINADPETSGKLLEKLDKTELDEDSDLNLSILDKLSNKDLFEEKLEVISIRSKVNENSIKNFIKKSIEDANNEKNIEKNIEKITKIIEKSESIVNENIIESGEENEAVKKKVTEIITKVIEKNPEKAIEIFEKNKKTKKISKIIKTKIENGDAITGEDFDDVFDTNISPN
jgi:hypothetical protein